MSTGETAVSLEELASLPEFYHVQASPSDDRIAFYYDGTGRNELYVLDLAAGERRQVSDGNVPRDARSPLLWGASGERVYFHRDEGGNEQYDVHGMDLDGETEPVIEAEGQNTLHDVGPDGRYLLYGSTKSGQMNLHRYDRESGEDERVTGYDQPVINGAFSPDGERIAYTTNESSDLENRDVYLAGADGSDARKLPVGTGGAQTVLADWAPDGSALLVGDEGEDVPRCGVYDLDAETVEWFGPGEFEERPVEVSPDGSELVGVRLRECGTVPVVYDRDTGEGRELALDEGTAFPLGAMGPGSGGGSFLADGDLLVNYTLPDRRKELYRYDLDTDDHRTVIEAEYGDVDPGTFVGAEYVTYESTDGLEIEGLLYDSGERPSPGIVSVHGGPHARASKAFDVHTQFLVSRGYSVFQPNYRGSIGRGREFKNAVHDDWGGMEQADVAEAGRWLEAREWIDADRVAVVGGSYGGYSAYMQLVTYPDLWTTGVAIVGITDLPSLIEESMPHFKTVLRQQMGDPEANADLWRDRSPLTHVENIRRPVLMVHGVNDPRVPVSQARKFRDALREMGWEEGEDFVYEELGEEGHGSTDIDRKTRQFRIVADYLDDWL